MKTEFLKDLGLSDDVIAKIFAESGKDVEREKAKAADAEAKLADANAALATYSEKITALESAAGDAQTYKSQLDTLKQQIAADKEAAERARIEREAEAGFASRFAAACGDAKFVNELTRDGIFAQFKGEIAKEENKGKGDREIDTALVNGKDDLFVNPNAPMPIVGGGNPPPQNQIDENAARAVMGLPPLAK